ncbi:MAG: VanZ family protein [Hespellia sp.]|nr:VanZ family protein [Hespellia sp.]
MMSFIFHMTALAGECFLDYLALLPFLLIIEILTYFYYKKKGLVLSLGFLIGWQILVGALCAIFYITGTAGLPEVLLNGFSLIRKDEVNLIPFSDGMEALFGLCMNCLLFLPIGFLTPFLWEKNGSFSRTLLTGFTFSLLIEISQLFNFRATDIDDLIMNTLGTALGFGLYRLLFRKHASLQAAPGSALCTILILFSLYFLAGIPYLNVIHRLYYGF